ncbi:hypothetical protein QQS21_002283 [Conoideocrella luteorostrata]|uniref:AB hydrolase-1 domain-containing protein n=1 Tax=Conoideocrella luteorostrata TaxID=1105319 RepID=A0AAJ0G314_9HYPO|nr:hypothetical protein QQS21_002283 [Conoideocrella luteorostrata]
MTADTSAEYTGYAQYLERPSFHRKFTLPATADHGALDVGFSDLGRQPASTGDQEDSLPVVLFMPGMFASRLHGVLMDVVGQKIGVRVVTVDRPGMGQSTDVKLTQRVAIWVELVPQLLAHLGIRHVSLVSHSAGTIYLLNTLYSCRDVLSPTRPYAALMAPWVDVEHSGSKLMQTVRLIPNALFGSWNTVAKTIARNIAPAIGSSLAFTGKCLQRIRPATSDEPEPSMNRLHWQREYGLSSEFLDVVIEMVVSDMFLENTAGANSEARQCLKKEGKGMRGVYEELDVFVQDLVAQERNRAQEGKLRVKVFFAEDDVMIGKGGQRYMDACWDHESEFADVLEYSSATVENTDHDNVIMTAAVLEEIINDCR